MVREREIDTRRESVKKRETETERGREREPGVCVVIACVIKTLLCVCALLIVRV